MIIINKNQANNIALTLNENSEIYASGGTPYWLFCLENGASNETKYFVPQYISANTRVNLLTISESYTDILTGGTVNLRPGYYSYKIYEQTTQYNIDLTGTTGNIVEYGKVLVPLTPNEVRVYTGNSTNNIIYYN